MLICLISLAFGGTRGARKGGEGRRGGGGGSEGWGEEK